MLIDASHCAVISGVTVRKGNQYKLYIGDDLSGEIERRNPPIQAATTVNREIEKMIMRDVPAWMWLHLRFKTRPKMKRVFMYNAAQTCLGLLVLKT